MKVVCDSSVLIAAQITTGGACAEALRLILSHHQLVMSEFILDEFERNLIDKFRFSAAVSHNTRVQLRSISFVVVPDVIPIDVCRDPNDAPILGTALSAKADVLISVDKDLLTLRQYQGVVIMKPGAFLVNFRN